MLSIEQIKQSLENEQVAVVLLVRLYFGTADADSVREILRSPGFRFRRFIAIAKLHGITQLIYRMLLKYRIEFPAGLMEQLRDEHTRRLGISMRMLKIVSELTAGLEERGIRVIPYKGPVFVATCYGDISLRASSDLDFLISERDIAAVEDYLIEKGYSSKKSVPRKRLNFYRRVSRDLVYKTPGDPIVSSFSVEMQWRLLDFFSGDYPDYDFFEKHCVEFQMQSLKLTRLSPTYDFLAVMSNHFVKDLSTRFKYIMDAAAMIRSYGEEIDYQLVFKTAKQYGFSKRLETGLELTEAFTGVRFATSALPDQPDAEDVRTVMMYPPMDHFLSDAGFLKRSVRLQDSAGHRLKFWQRYLQYIFVRGYIDVTAHNVSFPAMVKYTLGMPFRAIGKKKKRKLKSTDPQISF